MESFIADFVLPILLLAGKLKKLLRYGSNFSVIPPIFIVVGFSFKEKKKKKTVVVYCVMCFGARTN